MAHRLPAMAPLRKLITGMCRNGWHATARSNCGFKMGNFSTPSPTPVRRR